MLMVTETLAELRAEIAHLVEMRVNDGLSLPDQRRYEALVLREAELLTCGRRAEAGASVVEYAMVASVFGLALLAALT